MNNIIPKKIDFHKDIDNHYAILSDEIANSRILVIGGAGTIGSNYIKQILNYKPSKIVVVDINENGLAELTRDLRSSKLLDYNPEYITYPVNLLSKTFDTPIQYVSLWKILNVTLQGFFAFKINWYSSYEIGSNERVSPELSVGIIVFSYIL